MQLQDSTFYSYRCSLCGTVHEISKDLPVLELDAPYSICLECFASVKALRLRRPVEDVLTLLGRRGLDIDEIILSFYHPKHYKVAHLVGPGQKTSSIFCDCCGHEIFGKNYQQDKKALLELKATNEGLFNSRTEILKIMEDLKISFDLCDVCVPVVKTLIKLADTPQQLKNNLNSVFVFKITEQAEESK